MRITNENNELNQFIPDSGIHLLYVNKCKKMITKDFHQKPDQDYNFYLLTEL